jgi:hypothetical protein
LAAAGGSGVGAIVGVRTAVGAAGVEGGAVGFLSRVVVPLAAIAFFSQLTDVHTPSAEQIAQMRVQEARHLREAVLSLLRDIAELDVITALLALNSATAAGMTTKELLQHLEDLLQAGLQAADTAIGTIVNELLKRFPKCAAAIRAAGQEVRRSVQFGQSVMTLTKAGRPKNPRLEVAKHSIEALDACIKYLDPH